VPKGIIIRIIPFPGQFDPIPYDEWTESERTIVWTDDQGHQRIGRCTRKGTVPSVFNFAQQIYRIATSTPEEDGKPGRVTKQSQLAIGELLRDLDPDYDNKFDFVDGQELIIEQGPYSELRRLLDAFDFGGAKHPLFAQLILAIEEAREVSRPEYRAALTAAAEAPTAITLGENVPIAAPAGKF
jgi:hypothetical protein